MELQARKDEITSAKIETAMIFERMLGEQDARNYLRDAEVPETLIERVLSGGARRPLFEAPQRDTAPTPSLPAQLVPGFYSGNGRRRDTVRAAVVQAALALRPQLGDERLRQMLQREGLSEQVVDRVLRQQEGSVRARGATPPPQA